MASKISTSITIYAKTNLSEDKRLALDSVSSFLAATTGGSETFSNVMLEKDAFDQLDVSIKLEIPPLSLVTDTGKGWDYLKINFSTPSGGVLPKTSTYYYFVKAVRWISAGAAEIRARLDVLNTILPQLTFSDETVTKRRHFDRFKDLSGGTAMRVVHKIDEGIAPIQYRVKDTSLIEGSQTDNWNLIYRNANPPDPDQYHQYNPVELHIALDKDAAVDIASESVDFFTYDEFTGTSSYYYITAQLNGLTITDGTNTHVCTIALYFIEKAPDGELKLGQCVLSGGTYYPGTTILSGETLQISAGTVPTQVEFVNAGSVPTGPLSYDFTYVLGSTSANIHGVHESYDRTDSELIKITKVPYAPVAITYASSVYSIPSGWKYDFDTHDLVAKDINAKYKRTITFSATNYLYAAMVVSISPNVATPTTRNIAYESKLYHSAFHSIKFAYDSFSTTLPLENVNSSKSAFTSDFTASQIKVSYTVSTTMSGRFMFRPLNVASHFANTEDFPFFVAVARNNEEPIFTSAYIQYLRTGYNYDVKARQQQGLTSAVSIGASVAGAAVAGLTATGGNPAGAVAGAIIGASASVINAMLAQESAERRIQENLNAAKAQSVSIAGSDDVDLMVEYCGNRLHQLEYEPSDAMKQSLFNFFYYYGYACNETGAPTHNNRYFFDYLECEARFLRSTARSFTPAFIEDVQGKLAQGVTFLHTYMCNHAMVDTTYENWENSLL